MERDSMVFYRSFSEAIEQLEEEDQLKAFWNIIRYGLHGIEPEGKGAANAVFKMAKPQIDANNKRYQNGSKGGRKASACKPNNNQTETKLEPKPNQEQSNQKPNENVNVNDNVNDKKESAINSTKEKRFIPPTVENVRVYCQESGYVIDEQRFVDFYESKGWYVGKNKMKDWKAAVRNWARQSGRKEAEPVEHRGTAADFYRQYLEDSDS